MLTQNQKPTILKLTRLAITNGNTSQYQAEVKQLDDIQRDILKSMKTVYAKSQYHIRLAKGTNRTKHTDTPTDEPTTPLDPIDEYISPPTTTTQLDDIPATPILYYMLNDDEHIDMITQPEDTIYDKTDTYFILRTKIPPDLYERLNKLTVMLLKADGDRNADSTNEQLKRFYDSIMEKYEVVLRKSYDEFKLYKQRDAYTTTDSDVEIEKYLCGSLNIPFVNDKKKLRKKKTKKMNIT